MRYDLTIIGAGPAGASAAACASELGLKVLIVDEAAEAGGQIYKAPVRRSNRSADGAAEGDALRATLSASAADRAFRHRVWSIAATPSGFDIAAVGPDATRFEESAAVIIATGTIERIYPRPGWTLPGVIGLGAATVMMKAYGVLPGRRVVVAGPGPLAPLVASLIAAAGGTVAAVVDPNAWSRVAAAVPGLAARPQLLAKGLALTARLVANRVPVLHGWDVRSIEGDGRVERVVVQRVDDRWQPTHAATRTFAADAVCLAYGLTPAIDFYRLLDAALDYRPDRGGWVPVCDDGQRTSVPRLYAAGDGAGVLGAKAAPLTGRLAALSAAADLGALTEVEYARHVEAIRRERPRVDRFALAIGRLIAPRPSAVAAADDGTIVCRCEDVTAGELRRAVAQGSSDINALKSATRCGMGPCGGRMCADAVAALMECAGCDRSTIGLWTARTPLRPIAIDDVTGVYDYGDIPLPEPSPL